MIGLLEHVLIWYFKDLVGCCCVFPDVVTSSAEDYCLFVWDCLESVDHVLKFMLEIYFSVLFAVDEDILAVWSMGEEDESVFMHWVNIVDFIEAFIKAYLIFDSAYHWVIYYIWLCDRLMITVLFVYVYYV